MKALALLLWLAVLCLALACTRLEAPTLSTAAGSSSSSGSSGGASHLATAIDHAREHGWTRLRIVDECRREGSWTELRIYGSGVAIWHEERQSALPRSTVDKALAAFVAADFAAMEEIYGGRGSTAPEVSQGLRFSCVVTLELDGHRKQVAQLVGGYQHAALQQLAERLFALAGDPQSGITAADLGDGLAKIAGGELAAETLKITAHRKPSLGSEGEGWLLQLAEGRAEIRPYRTPSGYGEPIERTVAVERLRRLAARLAELAAHVLPANLWAEDYQELRIDVLGHETSALARPFTIKDEGDDLAARKQFADLMATLEAFYGETLATSAAR